MGEWENEKNNLIVRPNQYTSKINFDKGSTILRIDHKVTPDEANKYEDEFQKIK
ncbi:hypothetical protein [Clostridium cibarium]|uniref:Lipoprotein n=1 Tax=Clostridium cibarium TaxID=2762247 RepID=A0ABR8PTF3_9CLOT|nr:hypothetical protein [Clostridium cibarium]MBD7911446.1 hypothetical protein [Clostridium cibarium]